MDPVFSRICFGVLALPARPRPQQRGKRITSFDRTLTTEMETCVCCRG